MHSIRFLALVFIVLASAKFGAEPAHAQEAPVFDDSTTVVVVEVPVNVIKDGAPVRGLTAENFKVLDERQERALIDFEVVDLKRLQTAADRPAAQVPISARRHFLFLLDLSFSQAENLLRATESARSLLATALHPSDLVAVGVYGKRTQAGMLLNFTPDHAQVDEVLTNLEQVFSGKSPEADSRRASDPLGLVAGPYSALVSDIGRAAGLETTLAGEWLEEGNLHPDIADTLIDMDELTSARQMEGSRSDIANLSRSLSALAQQTRGIDGRKYMVYFSEGFSSDLLFEEGGARTLRDLDKMIKEMQRAGWVLQTVNTARSGESLLDDADGLLMIARETGGDFYTNFNRLDNAMEQMLDSTSVTYLLVVQADDVKMDGAFRELKVRLENAPRGAKVRHRAGYYAPSPLEEPQGLSEQLRLAELVLAGEEGGALPASVSVASFSGAKASQVTTWIEVDGPSLLLGHEGDRLDLEIYGYALSQENEIRDFFSQRLGLDLGEHRTALEKSGLRFFGDFELPPGTYDLRLLVRRAADGRYGLRTAPIEVSPAQDGVPRLLPPFFLSDGELVPWLVAGESNADESQYPFIVGERRFVPLIRPVVSKSVPARICLMGYELDHPSLSLQAQLTAADGSLAAPDALGLVGKNEGADGDPTQLFFNLDASNLAPGEYTMTISVQDPDSGAADQTSMSFRVEA